MGIEIKAYSPDQVEAVKAFNVRLKQVDTVFEFPESPLSKWLPKREGRSLFQEFFLALEKPSTVRGGYILKHQMFSFLGKMESIGNYQLPLSEALVDKKYSLIGVQLLMSALKKNPLLYCLGMGSRDRPLPKMLKAMGWQLHDVPFFFKVNHPQAFLKNISFLRSSAFRRAVIDLARVSGGGWAGIKLIQFFSGKIGSVKKGLSVEVVPVFSAWADTLWFDCMTPYAMTAVRDRVALDLLYPKSNKQFIRLKVSEKNQVIGWAVLLDTPMSGHKQFGDMRVGSIIDCFASPENAVKVIQSATGFLEKTGVDMIISNQSHTAWCTALKYSGFLEGPSNFIFAASKKLSEQLSPFQQNKVKIHLNRGDGDGPIHL